MVALRSLLRTMLGPYLVLLINYYFKDSHVSKGNTLDKVTHNYSKFTTQIKIQEWYDGRINELKEILDKNDYLKLLAIFNNKGLKTIGNKYFKISDFIDRAIMLLQGNEETREFIRAYFPKSITDRQ